MRKEDYLRWVNDSGDSTLRVNYNLNTESVVLDFGGYEGNWADIINKKYGCYLYIFEPIAEYYNNLVIRFQGNNKIKVFNYGVSNETQDTTISLSDDASSIYGEKTNTKHIHLKSIIQIFSQRNLHTVDLLKINIEGEEYNVLDSMIENNLHTRVENIQVQFHTFIDNHNQRRESIRSNLVKTHKLTYDYPFVWENWQKIN